MDRERNRLGQFFTPPALARQIAEIALSYHGGGPIRFLEPSVGAFYCTGSGRRTCSSGTRW